MNDGIHLYLPIPVENRYGLCKCKTGLNHLSLYKVGCMFTHYCISLILRYTFPCFNISVAEMWFMISAGQGGTCDVVLLFVWGHSCSH